jgi:hypothetical protein
MAFAGNDEAVNTMLRDAAVREIQNLGGYNPRPVPKEEYPGDLVFPPDEAPAREYLGSARYALTGEFFINPGQGLGYFQLWLWNSADGSLVLTDESVAGDGGEALNYLPAMISWIFSRIPKEEGSFPLANAPALEPKNDILLNYWLYMGLRGGGSFRFYTLPALTKDYYSDAPLDFSFEVSLQAAFKFLPFMSLQAEMVLTHDSAKFRGPEYHQSASGESWHIFYTDSYSSTSLLFPVTVKFPLALGPYIISPFGGIYWTLPLGRMALDSNIATRKTGMFSYGLTGYLGLTAGLDLGMRLGPGIIFLDTRYSGDLGETVVWIDRDMVSYKRAMLSLSIGYELALLNKGRRGGRN